MRIFIATGIYPPEIGGPAEYARNLQMAWERQGHNVSLGIFSRWNFLPTGVRHFAYFLSILAKVWNSELVIILDTFSCALPATIAGIVFGKKIILRTGGDFLWEAYVERTGDLVLLRDFYKTRMGNLNMKEQMVFSIIRYILRNVHAVVFSTKWQEEIFWHPYGLQERNTLVIENYYGPKISFQGIVEKPGKQFLASTRKLRWKNISMLEDVFSSAELQNNGAKLFLKHLEHEEFLREIAASYAVILVSLGDISPNMILDAIRLGKPFILSSETGIADRIRQAAIFVDPKDKEAIREKVLWLLEEKNYLEQKRKVEEFDYQHSWDEMAKEYTDLSANL